MLTEPLTYTESGASELREEITRVQDALQRKSIESAASIAEGCPLAVVLRLRSEETELGAYLKGLTYLEKRVQTDC
jgi:hypothetical protein